MAEGFQLMIPDSAEVPAYVLNPELARQMNEAAIDGVSTGFPPRIKMAGKNSFALVDGNGGETAIPMGKLFQGPDSNLYLRAVVLRAKPGLQKLWYATKYDPNKDGQAPDCFSNDGQKPDPSIPTPQCETCAGCSMNAFGSGTDQNGNASNGKACSDNKNLAVFLPPLQKGEAAPGVHGLKIAPASLKNWGLYVKALNAKGIPVGNVFTLIGFDQTQTFPVLTFQFGGFLSEQAIAAMAKVAASPEAEEIISQKITYSAKPAPAAAPAAGGKKAAAPKEKVTPIKKEEPKVEEDDLGLGGPATTQQAAAPAAAPAAELTDDELAAELGL